MFKSVAIMCVLALGVSAYPGGVPESVLRTFPGGSLNIARKPVQAAIVKSSSDAEHVAPVLRFESDVSPVGYSYNYETGNGISAESTGTLKKVDNADVLVQQGSYRYSAPDGTPVFLTYVADETGYHPQSDLLPVAPEIPEAILRSIKYNQEHPAKEQDTVYITKKF